ncbi:MAG: hypothetical protein NPIRA02_22470 [Nitrospirales bacterium]|nr:MAG: hypothetical protein NPIRA02_22470 [Nitrospirales bacterium]
MTNSMSSSQSKIPYLYITGQGYSGSTLLCFLLNSHPEIMTIGEAGPVERFKPKKYRCSCGQVMTECPFFLELEKQVKKLGSTFNIDKSWKTRFRLSDSHLLNVLLVRSLGNNSLELIRDRLVPYLYPGYKQEIEEISQRVVHVAQAAMMIQNKTAFVDALKDSRRIKFLKDIEQIDLKVVHLVKDIRASVVSTMKHTGKDVAWAARYWRRINSKADLAKKLVSPDRWLRLRYSDLCADPQGSVDRITDLMGLKPASLPKDFYTVEHHIMGNKMRRQSSGVVKEDLAWKEKLPDNDLNVIARIGGSLNRYFGYDFP